MADYKIKWKKGDLISLGKAVSQFNKKINELQKEENKLYLPEKIDFNEAKENIFTRKELKRLINSLRRFQKEGAEELYKTQSGEEMTKWERQELGIQSRIAQTRLRKELKELNKPTDSGFSKAQMGSQRVKEIKAQIENLRQIEKKSGYEFNMLKRRIQNVGKSDYSMRKAIIFRENYYKMLENYKNYENYERFIFELDKIKNPKSFYEFISQNELLADINYMYDLSGQGILGITDNEKFNYMLETIGIDVNHPIKWNDDKWEIL